VSRTRKCPALMTVLVGVATALTSCGNDPAVTKAATPVAAAQAWFTAVNDKNLAVAQSHFVASQRSMMDWGGGDKATWSTFTKRHCKTLRDSGKTAIVYCSFTESASASEGNPDSFWTISLQRKSPGPWLINNYGQG